ncbi:fluoride efflux transporter CrcB [Calidifontibacter sp. DB0510]|uniref:Fluoride-specific ion channel FluC n=1 Tax=Metallococcus carri TaxID=1656884 RepID=A0A967AXF5_9MICO|nr:fluoride efflux transporter CrcB [Metallococcus carri]NHN54779.1 fluoride efflux transporter CrcB [Metallococcus carri]NOP37124.1 fluoride efflux transporter CrcB [Calidifontibacter sp. DB2511S]
MIPVLVALGGGLGAVARFVFDSLVNRHRRGPIPWGTVMINVIGSFLLGLLTGALTHQMPGASPTVKAILGTGFCGGFTTFSTASVETFRLWEAGRRPSPETGGTQAPASGAQATAAGAPRAAAGARMAVAYAVLSLVGSAAAAFLGLGLSSL